MTQARRKPDEWMPLHIGPYLKDTMHLTTLQHGAYLLLLMAYWMGQGPLPDDDAALSAIAKLDQKTWRKSVRNVVANFFEISDGKWRQKKADEELARAIGLTEIRSKAGKTGGLASAMSRSKPEANGAANGEQSGNQTPKQTPKQTGTPIQSTESSSKQHLSQNRARESVEVDTEQHARLCKLLLLDGNDFRNWTAFIAMKVEHGLDFERHIWPAAQHHAQTGKRGTLLAYIRPKAIEIRDTETARLSAPVVFEDCDDETWRGRIRFWFAHPELAPEKRWPAKWGPHFSAAGHKVPAEIAAEFKAQVS